MYKKIIFVLILSALLISPALGAGGSGTQSDPYIIETAAELQSVQNNLAAYYQLANDIDLSGVTWTPIGQSSAGFHGSFDGNGKSISNLVISGTKFNVGFFGVITSGATIKDITFVDCAVTSSSSLTGLVFGSIQGSASNHDVSTINNINCVRCTVIGTNSDVGVIGGLVSNAAVVDIINCDVSYTNVESNYHSGVIGYVSAAADLDIIGGSVKNSKFVTSHESVGVLAHVTSTSSVTLTETVIENCIFKAYDNRVGVIGTVAGAASATMNEIQVINCVMTGTTYVGGLIGFVDKDHQNNVGSNIAATNCVVTDTTIYATANYAGGVGGRINTLCTGLFDDCTVTGCTILANSYAASICPAYS